METVLAWVVLILIVYIIKTKKDNKFKTSDNINMIQAPPTLSSLYDKKIYLLTSDELKFYKLLKPIVNRNELNLFTQVALYEIVKAKDIKDFNKIKSKSIDFVITDLIRSSLLLLQHRFFPSSVSEEYDTLHCSNPLPYRLSSFNSPSFQE